MSTEAIVARIDSWGALGGTIINEMRDWALDCSWGEDPEEIEEMGEVAIIRGVANHYDGGIDAFLRSSGPPTSLASRSQFDIKDRSRYNRNMEYTMTRAEWKAVPRDYKLTEGQSQDGKRHCFGTFVPGYVGGGTDLVPVTIVKERVPVSGK